MDRQTDDILWHWHHRVVKLGRQNVAVRYFGTSADTQQWAQPVTAGVHGVSSKKCRLEVVE